MDSSTKPDRRPRGVVRRVLTVLALAVAIGGTSTAIARADEYDHNRGHEDRGHQQGHRWDRQRHDDRGYHGYVYERPQAYYAPPVVDYYQPPPPPPAVDFVFPLYLR